MNTNFLKTAALRLRSILMATLCLTSFIFVEQAFSQRAKPDFNGDGYADLVVGVPNEDLNNASTNDIPNAGQINVIYGTATGLDTPNNRTWSQKSVNIGGDAESEDRFGYALATGDFNDDGYTDLAVGVPFENLFINGVDVVDAGAVNIIYGSPNGLIGAGSQLWTQTATGAGVSNANDKFGFALSSADFDGDGFADLAIGVPGETVDGVEKCGLVNVIYGSANGLSSNGSEKWSQNKSGVLGTPNQNDNFGFSLAAGDFDNDGFSDLAIGAPGEVNVLYGSANGLTGDDDQLLSQDLMPEGEGGAGFGATLAAGDFDGNGHDDLVIKTQIFPTNQNFNVDAVNVLYGDNSGLATTLYRHQLWHEDSYEGYDFAMAGIAEPGEGFGNALAAGDFNNDGRDDLAIGVPGQILYLPEGLALNAGAIHIIYGASDVGLSPLNNHVLTQEFPGINGEADSFDSFGSVLTVGDYDGNGKDDLAVSIPGEDLAGVLDAGAVNVIYGRPTGLTGNGQIWSQHATGIDGVAENGDNFGGGIPITSPFPKAGRSQDQSRATAETAAPSQYALEANYPNPFNPQTTIGFALPQQSFVTLKVYNMLGQEVAAVVAKRLEAGVHRVTFDAGNLPSGTYLYQIQAEGFSQARRMVLMK